MDDWVLVVDAHDDGREVLVELLCQEGFHAIGAPGAIEALAILERGPTPVGDVRALPSVVLCDVRTPEIQADHQLYEESRKRLGDGAPPFIFLTWLAPSDLPPLPALIPVMRKPYDVDELLAEVKKHCSPQPPRWSAFFKD